MDALSSIAKCLAGPCNAFFSSVFNHVMSCPHNMETLKNKIEDLQIAVDDVRRRIDEAARERKRPKDNVNLWMRRAQNVIGDATRLDTEFRDTVRRLEDRYPSVFHRYMFSVKAVKMINKAKDMEDTVPQDIAIESATNDSGERPAGSMVGGESELEKLQELAGGDQVTTIGIYGMGGVGKTKLLEKFCEQSPLRNTHMMLWIDMKDCINVEDAQKAIARGLLLHWTENLSESARRNHISKYLKQNNFVLILDNVWKEVELTRVGIPITGRETRTKVILATRRKDVCHKMTSERIQIKCLERSEAGSLFVEKAGKDLDTSNKEIKDLVEVLVAKCGGLPSALITVGQDMATQRTPRAWMYAIKILEDKPLKIQGMKEVLSRLKLSYDNLADNKLRTFLLYCILLPEGYEIHKEKIIDYCIGEGVLGERIDGMDDVYNEGFSLLDDLKSASMLEAGSDSEWIKMHPMVRTLALWIESSTENKCLVKGGKKLDEAPDVDEWTGVERISLVDNSLTTLSERPESHSLLTLFLNQNPLLRICNGFFQSMEKLKVLDLSRTYLEEVPAEIGALIQLRYLDFSNTAISSLPQELENLVNLRYFLLSDTPYLTTIPRGLFRNLSKLLVLNMYSSYDDWRVDEEGFDFEGLRSLRLKALGITLNTVRALNKLAESARLASCTRQLEIKLCPGLRRDLPTEALTKHFKVLTKLRLCELDFEELSIDQSFELPNLTELYLIDLPRAKMLWNNGRLKSVRILTIDDCEEIRELIHCYDEERLGEIDALPNLYRLNLFNLPELESLSCGRRLLAFPSLEILHVRNCPKLKTLPLHAEKLRSIYCQKSWWDKLEWPEVHDATNSSKFDPIFMRTTEEIVPTNEHENSVLEQLQQLALDDSVSTLGIYGMAGVGKTRVLRKFCNQFPFKDDYLMLWIDMNGIHNVEEAQEALARTLKLAWYQNKSKKELAMFIGESLKDINFLLILDNVWEVVDLNDVGIPSAAHQPNHKVILATRLENICDSMECSAKIQMKCLDSNAAWSLFVKKVGQEIIESDQVIENHAELLVEKCGGLPLALRTVGRAMAGKQSRKMWETAVMALKSEPLKIQGMKEVLSCLKLSYDNLADDKLRKLLLYCAMFGEFSDIRKNSITDYTVSEGILGDDLFEGSHLCGEGYNPIDVLKAASLIGACYDSDYVEMHPMIRALAKSISGDKWLLKASENLTGAPYANGWAVAERISLMGNYIKTLSVGPNCPSLMTLLLCDNPLEEICDGFFKSMKNLRVLDLSCTSIRKVPEEIGELVELRYLCLYNTRITSLPRELGNLVKLRFLSLSYMNSLTSIPEQLIAKLVHLQDLYMYNSYNRWEVETSGDGVGFEELSHLHQLKTLGLSMNSLDALQKLVGSPALVRSTSELQISFCRGLTVLSAVILGKDFNVLKYLWLHRCSDLELLSDVDPRSAGSNTLPNLEYLTVDGCGEMKQLIRCDNEPVKEGEEEEEERFREINILPNLKRLELFRLPSLKTLSCGSRPLVFPSLEILDVIDCPELKKLPLRAEKLEVIYGQSSWWDGLDGQGDNDGIKTRCLSLFVEAYS